MKFDIREREENKEYFVINLSKECLLKLKQNLASIKAFEIDDRALNLEICLYGKTKNDSIQIQKKNCKQMLKLYAVCVKVVKLLRRKKFEFDGIFYTRGLNKKKNNGLERVIDHKKVEEFIKKLGFAQKNTVIVGANGCGKTSLANLLKKKLNKNLNKLKMLVLIRFYYLLLRLVLTVRWLRCYLIKQVLNIQLLMQKKTLN